MTKPIEQSWQRLTQLLLHEQRRNQFWGALLFVETRTPDRSNTSFYVILQPDKEEQIMQVVNIGHTIAASFVPLDANGNPMLTPVTYDAPPTWVGTTPDTETLKVSADGMTCEADPVAPGTDAVTVTAVVGGKTFSAVLAVEVDPAPQVLTSIAIKAVVS
jgi:hypothetical protein